MTGYNQLLWKSNRALKAETEGCLPLTKAITRLKEILGCTGKQAREALLEQGASEYHHTSKHFNITKYYNFEALLWDRMNDGCEISKQYFETKRAKAEQKQEKGKSCPVWMKLKLEMAVHLRKNTEMSLKQISHYTNNRAAARYGIDIPCYLPNCVNGYTDFLKRFE